MTHSTARGSARRQSASSTKRALGVLGYAGFAVAALGSLACLGALDPPTLVKTPRILGIVAEPPESAPGTEIRVGAIAFVPDDPSGSRTRYVWRLCASLPRVLAAAAIPARLPLPDTCETLPSEGPTATIPGDRTRALAALLSSLPSSGALDASFLARILETAGIPFQVEVDVVGPDGAVLVTGVKTVAITTRMTPPPTTNPPVVLFSIGDADVAMPNDLFDFACIPTSGSVTVAAGREVPITPIPGVDWTEEYPIYDYSGNVRTGRENEYYSFYATGGSLSKETTRPPERAVRWTAPEEPGSARVWMIVRDGHLGARGCWLDVTVGPRG